MAKKEMGVLKISTQDDAGVTTLKIEGRVVGDWVDELNRFWTAWAPSVGGSKVRLDICGVLYLDNKGKQAVREIVAATNAEILADSPLTKQFSDEVKPAKKDRKGGSRQYAKLAWI